MLHQFSQLFLLQMELTTTEKLQFLCAVSAIRDVIPSLGAFESYCF